MKNHPSGRLKPAKGNILKDNWRPLLLIAVLALPCLSFSYLWDDFDFLGRAIPFRLANFLPDRQTLFYRPVTRELYFGILAGLHAPPFVGHLVNLLCAAAVLLVLIAITRQLAGGRAGQLAATLFASFGALPTLVGWVSGMQDLLAILLALLALFAELRGKSRVGPVFFVLAFLSKETAIAYLPGILYATYIGERSLPRLGARAVTYVACIVPVIALHPATRLLLHGQIAGSPEGYLAGPEPSQLQNLLFGALTVVNLPLGMPSFSVGRPYLMVGLPGLLILGFARKKDAAGGIAGGAGDGPNASIALGCLLLVPALLASTILRIWPPYQSCIAGVGFAILGGTVLSRGRIDRAWGLAGVYLVLGLLCRATPLEAGVTGEEGLRTASAALTAIERGFKALRPEMPRGAAILVSVQFGGPSTAYFQLYRFQPLRVWYQDPTLFVSHPHNPPVPPRRELLFWITPQYEVFEIDLGSLQPRGRGIPQVAAYEKALRRYAVGRAATGDDEEAVRILTRIDARDPVLRAYDWRLAAALLLARGKIEEATTLLREVPRFRREKALDFVMTTLGEPVPGLDIDDALMTAFGIDPKDPSANRSLLLGFERQNWAEPEFRFAKRVQALSPGDPVAKRVLASLANRGTTTRITIPIDHE